jgi:hypothetical protein
MTKKFYFPGLKPAITSNGWTQEEFKQHAFKISKSPSAKSWSLAMSPRKGITEPYAHRAKRILEELEFPSDVCSFEECAS